MIKCARDAGIEVLGNQAKNPAELLVARGGRILLDDRAGEIVVAVPGSTARTLWPSPKEFRSPPAGTDDSQTQGFGAWLLSRPQDSARHPVWFRADHRRETGAANEIGSREHERVSARTGAVGETEGAGCVHRSPLCLVTPLQQHRVRHARWSKGRLIRSGGF